MQSPWEWVDTLRRADPDELVDALEARYLKERLEARRAAPYERARALLREREARLQRETTLAEHLLQRTPIGGVGGGSVGQHELTLQGPAGQPTAGRFLLANDHDRPADFTFGAPRWFDEQGVEQDGAAVTLSPEGCTLGPGEARRVRVATTLGAAPAEVLVPVLADGAPALQLWVRVLPQGMG